MPSHRVKRGRPSSTVSSCRISRCARSRKSPARLLFPYTDSMTDDEKPRTALEIAMERLKQRDAESGVVEQPPSDAQKAAIAEAKSIHAAKVAELEILQRSKVASVFDRTERDRLDAEYHDELRRLNDDLDRKVGKIRRAGKG